MADILKFSLKEDQEKEDLKREICGAIDVGEDYIVLIKGKDIRAIYTNYNTDFQGDLDSMLGFMTSVLFCLGRKVI